MPDRFDATDALLREILRYTERVKAFPRDQFGAMSEEEQRAWTDTLAAALDIAELANVPRRLRNLEWMRKAVEYLKHDFFGEVPRMHEAHVLEWLRTQRPREERTAKRAALLPDLYRNRDFFVANLFDVSPKDDLASMEHPMFSLSKKPDIRARRYEHNGNTVEFLPSVYGLPLIWDKDVLIYCISQLVEGMNRGIEPRPAVRFTVYEYLVSTNRSLGGDRRKVGGSQYQQLEAALNRLKTTTIKTDIKTGGQREKRMFGLIDEWGIIERSETDERMIAVEVVLSDWIYRAVRAREVLTISFDYFRLYGGLERRLYEIARKHCGKQATFTISVELLRKKAGSDSPLKMFRHYVKKIQAADSLPDYRLSYREAADQVVFYTRDAKRLLRSVAKGPLGITR